MALSCWNPRLAIQLGQSPVLIMFFFDIDLWTLRLDKQSFLLMLPLLASMERITLHCLGFLVQRPRRSRFLYSIDDGVEKPPKPLRCKVLIVHFRTVTHLPSTVFVNTSSDVALSKMGALTTSCQLTRRLTKSGIAFINFQIALASLGAVFRSWWHFAQFSLCQRRHASLVRAAKRAKLDDVVATAAKAAAKHDSFTLRTCIRSFFPYLIEKSNFVEGTDN